LQQRVGLLLGRLRGGACGAFGLQYARDCRARIQGLLSRGRHAFRHRDRCHFECRRAARATVSLVCHLARLEHRLVDRHQ
jgi:hypothetical protein